MTDPYYEEDGITIYHGDCRELLGDDEQGAPLLAYDAVVTDPPYGVNAEYRPHGKSSGVRAEWDDRVPFELLAAFADVPVLWFGASPALVESCRSFSPPPDRVLVWAPKFTLSMVAKGGIAYRWHAIYAWRLPKQSPAVHDVLTDSTECGNWWDHQATKPLSLMTRLVAMTPGTVLDPFMGSGTTLRAAKDLGRRAIGIELEERYCEIAATRLAQGVLDFGGAS